MQDIKSTQKSVVFVYTYGFRLSGEEIKKLISLTIASKTRRYLVINITKEGTLSLLASSFCIPLILNLSYGPTPPERERERVDHTFSSRAKGRVVGDQFKES